MPPDLITGRFGHDIPGVYDLTLMVISCTGSGRMQLVQISNCFFILSSNTVSEDVVRLYFENKKKSGGGDVRSVRLDRNDETCSAVVIFEHAEGN